MNHKLEMQELTESCVTRIADWWFDKFIDKDQFKDNGAYDIPSLMAGALGGMLAEQYPVTEEHRIQFRSSIARLLFLADRFPYAHGMIDFGADYHPTKLLSDAMEEAGIHHSRCPIKTQMEIGHFESGSGVYVSAGYVAPYEPICDLSGADVTKRRVCQYTSVTEAFKGANGDMVPEKRYDRLFYAYDDRAWEEFRDGENWNSCTSGSLFQRFKLFVSEHREEKVDGAWSEVAS